MLVHALRDVFREEKEAGASTKETGDLILRLARPTRIRNSI